MRPPRDDIPAPPFPGELPWVNVASLRMDKQVGRPVLVEFWDFCRPNSMRTLPYLRAWHERYAGDGLRVVGIHAGGFEPSQDAEAVTAACERLEVTYPVVVDVRWELWDFYGNEGWPSRYLWNQEGMLADFHHGEGGYAETETAIQELLGRSGKVMDPIRSEDAPGAEVGLQSEDVAGPYSGPYAAGGVWAVASGGGVLQCNSDEVAVDHPGAYPLIEHHQHTEGTVVIEPGEGVVVHATCFTPGRV